MADFIVVHSIKVAKDFTPETFGRLTTIGPRFTLPIGKQGYRRAFQVCQCSCGGTCVVSVLHLKTSHTKSCGCLQLDSVVASRTKHGLKNTTEYRIWSLIIQRCNNPKNPAFSDYGGRGITVHPDWLIPEKGFQNFYDYMGPRPSLDHSVDRHPNKDGNYEPGNVRWATRKEQARNKRNNVLLTYNGKTQCINAWEEELGVARGMIRDRLRSGWSVEDALMTPKKCVKYSLRK